MSATLRFVAPLSGFDGLVLFELAPVSGADGLFALRSAEVKGLRLFVLDASVHLPTYQPVISDDQRASLSLESADDAAVYVVVNPGNPETTVNLVAPVVVNVRTGEAAQFILDGDDWPLRSPLIPVA
jgi:flagellar assembly factor FliW